MKGNYVSTEATRVCDVSGKFGVALVNTNANWPHSYPRYRSPKGEVCFAGTDGQTFGIEIAVPVKGRFGVIVVKEGMNLASCRPVANDFSLEAFYLFESPKTRGGNIIRGAIVPGWKDVLSLQFSRDWDRFHQSAPAPAFKEAGVVRCLFVREREQRGVFGRPVTRQSHICGTLDRFEIDPAFEVVEVVLRHATTALLQSFGWERLSDSPASIRSELAVA